MYRYRMPVEVTSPSFDAGRVYADLKEAHADSVLLAIPPLCYDSAVQASVYEKLQNAVDFFKKTEMEIGVWFWAFWVDGKAPFTPIKGFLRDAVNEKCPLDPAFLEFARENMRTVARMKPDYILFDDDLRTGNLESGCGCLCDRHLQRMASCLDGKVPSRDGLFEKIFSGKPNRLRHAYLRAVGSSMEDFCREMRAALDAVDPTIRLGACSCLSVWDLDGTDTYTLAKILAGSAKPYTRLIGAPYWAASGSPGIGCRIADVIELERSEQSYSEDFPFDVDIFPEGDAYPRPRYTTPASYMELFDAALRFSGGFAGNQKYIFDYTSSADYERGYLAAHKRNLPLYEAIDRLTDGKTGSGIRVYHAMKRIEDADFTDVPVSIDYLQNGIFPVSARCLTASGIPTVYTGTGVAGIVGGESARHLPDSAFEKPLILDIHAAKILSERGIDVGIKAFTPSPLTVNYEEFPSQNEIIPLYHTPAPLYDLSLKEGVRVCSYFVSAAISEFVQPTDVRLPAAFTYTNADGARFLVLNYTDRLELEHIRRNYCRPRQITEALASFGVTLPVSAPGNPDIYVLCKESETEKAIGIFNGSPDAVYEQKLVLDRAPTAFTGIGCEVRADGKDLVADRIGAFEAAFVLLQK